MDDAMIIELFFERSELGIKELDNKYGRLCRSLSFNILNDINDAEECVNDGYLGVWNAIPPTKPNPLQAYVCKIVRNISLNLYNKKNTQKRKSNFDIAMDELEFELASPHTVETEIEAKELTKIIQEFLDFQSAENRVIFILRYALCFSYEDISDRVGISAKNVSVKLTRIRQQLKKYLADKEIFI